MNKHGLNTGPGHLLHQGPQLRPGAIKAEDGRGLHTLGFQALDRADSGIVAEGIIDLNNGHPLDPDRAQVLHRTRRFLLEGGAHIEDLGNHGLV